MSITINNTTISSSRIKKFINATDKKSATERSFSRILKDFWNNICGRETKKDQLEKAYDAFQKRLSIVKKPLSESEYIVAPDAEKTLYAFKALALASDKPEEFKITVAPKKTIKTATNAKCNPPQKPYLEVEYEFHAGKGNKIDISFDSKSVTKDKLDKFFSISNSGNKFELVIPKKDIDIHNAAIRLQAFVRRHNVTRPEDDHVDSVRTVRNERGKVLGYDTAGHIWSKPDPIKSSNKTAGLDKTLTHGGPHERNVGLTLHEPDKYKTIDQAVLEELEKNNIKYIVAQHRVSKNLVIAENLGSDLAKLTYFKIYKFSPIHFKSLILDMEKLHSIKIIHRDIKLENLFFKDGEVYLSDLDPMGYIDKLKSVEGSPDLIPMNLLRRANQESYGIRIDKLGILHSMIRAKYRMLPEVQNDTCRYSDRIIDDFVKKHIKAEYQEQVKKFLSDPLNNV